ncbi:MAG: ABC transporter permease [Campylobacterota bacterium]|nr:ABC transporter permease [Campylobacterota bacterium]
MLNVNIEYKTSNISTIHISGKLTKENIKNIYPTIKSVKNEELSFVEINTKELTSLDNAGAILLVDLIASFSQNNTSVTLTNLETKYHSILVFARKNLRQKPSIEKSRDLHVVTYIDNIGKNVLNSLNSFTLFLSFIGASFIQLFRLILTPWNFRFKATAAHIEKSGAQALPIVALTSFLVGLVIAYQGADQLAKFGANIFIVDMVSISVFRELAPLITAIVIAGRSASAYTAEIGTMKITEEIDAMRTMGFDPVRFLVLPRVIALVISMPLIVFFADIVGVFGGMIVAKTHLGISFGEFIARARDVVDMKHILIGLFKAPFFGLLIAFIGCFRGFQVTGSTESIGHYTTVSVVNAIFWVIACNAIISVVLTEIGI